MSRKQMQGPSNSSNRQESHRVYLQQYTKTKGKDFTLTTNSTAVRLTSVTNARDVCYLLRQKFGLPSLPPSSYLSSQASSLSSNSSIHSNGNSSSDNKLTSQQPLVHRIHARLNQVRQQSNNKQNHLKAENSNYSIDDVKKKQRRQRRKQRRKTVLECQLNEDVLVMVATCYVPKMYIQFEHEEYSFWRQQSSSNNSQTSQISIKPSSNSSDATSAKQVETNNQIPFQVEPLNIVETLVPSEIPLQRMDDLVNYTDKLQDAVEMEVFGKKKTSKKTRKAPLIHWFFIPRHDAGNNQIPKAAINIDGYCTDASLLDDSDFEDFFGDTQAKKQSSSESNDESSAMSWKNEIIDYSSNQIIQRGESQLEKERHHFTVLSTFESINGNDNISGYLLKQSHKDRNVWKKVHCVITENRFYYVSRVKKFGKNNSTRIGKHGIIDLNGTFLLESMLDSPLAGLPNTFQLTTKEGDVHIFQAGNSNAFSKWTNCLSERMAFCQVNSSFHITDSIISNEIQARQKRFEDYLLAPLEMLPDKTSMTNHGQSRSQVNLLMNLGLQITAYKEQCRRVQYAHSSTLLSSNIELTKTSQKRSQKIIEKPLWLNQSLENLTFAELLLTRCKDFSAMFKKGQPVMNDNTLQSRSEYVENEIHQCLYNLRKKNERYLLDYHKALSDASKENEERNQNAILLPEALFDEIFQVLSELLFRHCC